MRAYILCIYRLVMRCKRLGHSDNPALLRRAHRYTQPSREEKYIKKTPRQRYDSTYRAYNHYCTVLLIVQYRTVELALYVSVRVYHSAIKSAYQYGKHKKLCLTSYATASEKTESYLYCVLWLL